MNIVFDYYLSEPMTELTINGVIHSDMYGKLGAVCNYPVQSWLYPRGSWKGLRKVLNDFVRSREMSIQFIGWETDFDDFGVALEGMENTALSFQPAYEENNDMKKEWKDALMGRLGYQSHEADIAIRDMERLSLILRPILERWLVDCTESDLQVFHGRSIDSLDSLRAGSSMNFIAALLTLDWVVRNSDKATSVIQEGIK